MFKKKGTVRLAFGTINDDKVLGYTGEFQDCEIEEYHDFPMFTDPDTGYTLYEYHDALCTYKELRQAYLEDYYDVR